MKITSNYFNQLKIIIIKLIKWNNISKHKIDNNLLTFII